MSKKKKQTKFNTIVKKIFDGDGFDEGITRLESEELIELGMILQIKVGKVDDHELIKQLRRLWSEGDMVVRQAIVEYLRSLDKVFESSNSDAFSDKESKLLEVLSQLDATEDEKKMLYMHFIEQKAKKISLSKLERFISRYREQQKYVDVAEAAKGSFDEKGNFEFFHSFELELLGESFKKIFVLYAQGISDTLWQEKSKEELVAILQSHKDQAVEEFSLQLQALIEELSRKDHPYLSQSERLGWFKALEPESNLESFSLGFDLLYRVIKEHTQLHNLIITKGAVSAIKKGTYKLSLKEKIVYTYDLTMPLWKASAMVLKGEVITIDDELKQIDEGLQQSFALEYDALVAELQAEGESLGMRQESITFFINNEIRKLFESERTLSLTRKMHQQIVTAFALFTVDLRRQQQRETLLARTIRDFKALFPLARELKRQIIFHVGPTNSGKTYEAMQALKNADTGVYLAPLRLLALEGYENLIGMGVPAILLTGEEEIFDEDAGHVSSTIEMADFETEVDVAIIDEIQMIGDRDRGWAWANALIGIPAKKVYLTGSADVLEAVEALCEWLGEPLTVVPYERKNRQELLDTVTPLERISAGTALVAFSRSDVLRYRHKLAKHYKVSVIYGNLSPEVRREEARRFREGESEVLVATDAIAMGLNLPIKTLLFTKDSKFDGESRRLLTPSEVQQISGRAGRYGLEEVGFIGAISRDVLSRIGKLVFAPLEPIKPPFKVMANFEHIKLVASILQTDKLQQIFGFFSKHMEFDGPFEATDFESMDEVAQMLDGYEMQLKDKFTFATAPVSSAPYVMQQFETYINSFVNAGLVHFYPIDHLPAFADTEERLLEVEDRIKEISLYLWLAYRYEEAFIDADLAIQERFRLNAFMENSLKRGEFLKKCRLCSKTLPSDYEYNICQSCFMQQRRFTPKRSDGDDRGSEKRRKPRQRRR